MTIDEYKAQPFKYDGECKEVTIGDIWLTLSRKQRRQVEKLVKKGLNPDINDYLGYDEH